MVRPKNELYTQPVTVRSLGNGLQTDLAADHCEIVHSKRDRHWPTDGPEPATAEQYAVAEVLTVDMNTPVIATRDECETTNEEIVVTFAVSTVVISSICTVG